MPADPLTDLEAALTGLAPAPPRLDRDGLLFAAGRSAGSRPWKRTAGVLGVAMLALAGYAGLRPVRERERVIVVQMSAPAQPRPAVDAPAAPSPAVGPAAGSGQEYAGPHGTPQLEMRWRMMRWGPDSVPISTGMAAAPPARSLELDLNFPPGSLKGADGRGASSSSPW